ncbi:MAG: DUF4392 domain-containing protein [Synergistetes bacterium]|nr:DUF4392 domain-containing protein [Synergistota bacterium]MDK2871319.1 hypothetical protein [bacterium]
MRDFWQEVVDLIAEDAAHRGIADNKNKFDLLKACEKLLQSKKVAIFTGFTIMPFVKCETDGPLGAIFLARALLELGKNVSIWTDDLYSSVVEKGVNSLGIRIPVYGVPFKWGGWFFQLFWKEGFDLLISIERPGRGIDGRYYSSREEDITCYVSPLDEFFIEAKRRKIPTIGIGDGGNEIGMGNIREKLLFKFPEKGKIFSIVKVDHLIIGGISNWGGYGLIAGLAKLLSNGRLLPSPAEEEFLLNVMVDSGSIDGVTLEYSLSVDGVNKAILQRKLRELRLCLGS